MPSSNASTTRVASSARKTRESADHKARLKVLAVRRRELEDIAFEFKKARYDDPRSTFREDDLAGDLLNEFLRGAVSAGSYWSAWQKSQRWRPGTTDWGGGVGLPRSGRMSSTSSIGRANSWSGSRGGGPWGGGVRRFQPPAHRLARQPQRRRLQDGWRVLERFQQIGCRFCGSKARRQLTGARIHAGSM